MIRLVHLAWLSCSPKHINRSGGAARPWGHSCKPQLVPRQTHSLFEFGSFGVGSNSAIDVPGERLVRFIDRPSAEIGGHKVSQIGGNLLRGWSTGGFVLGTVTTHLNISVSAAGIEHKHAHHGAAWRRANAGHVSLDQLKVMSAIERCRTAALGGHVARCEDCAYTTIAYNSCRNRHCPKCQGAAAREWLAEREAELLPVPYFHVVFTLPARIAAIAYQNKAVVYDLLFKASSEAVLTIAADPSTSAPALASPPCSTPGARP